MMTLSSDAATALGQFLSALELLCDDHNIQLDPSYGGLTYTAEQEHIDLGSLRYREGRFFAEESA